jgi:uncharacterized protein
MRRFLISILVLLLPTLPAAGQEILEAARQGDLTRLQALVDADPAAVAVADERDCTALHFVVNAGHLEATTFLLEAGADLETRDVDGDSPLHWAACTDNVEMIELLLDHGAAINALNHRHITPLLYATQHHLYGIVEALARRGADLEIPNDYDRTPLIWTAREGGDLRMARLLLRLGADVDAVDRFNSSSLELAAWRGFGTLVGILLDGGAQTDLSSEMSANLLSHAANKGLDRLYTQLVADGLKIDTTPGPYSSLLHDAAGGGSRLIVEDLVTRGAPIDAVDQYGWTPLHHAADRGRTDAVAALLSAGCDKHILSLSGHSPLSLALARGAEDVVRSLEEAGLTGSLRDFPRLQGSYLGQGEPPGEPKPFALDIVASRWGEHGSISFTPDGREAFWSGYLAIPDSGYSVSTILTSRLKEDRWTAPEPAPFLGEYRGDVPFAAPDGEQVFFLSRRPLAPGATSGGEHIWVVERLGKGWSEPRPLPACVNEMPQHWQISVAGNGNLYFSSRRPEPNTQGVYVSRFVDGKYTSPEFLGFPGSTPYIAPDESFLITAESYGRENVIRFRQEDGVWGEAISIGAAFPGIGGICPKLTPDGRAFIFISQRRGSNNNFWVDAGFLAGLKASDRD